MAIIDVSEYTIGNNTYRYRDGSMISELAEKVNYSDVESTLDDTSTMPIQNQAVATAIDNLDSAKLDKTDIDNDFDIESENPVQNKVITAKINDIGDYARPAVPGSEEPDGHAGIVRVGPTLQMNTINNVEGFLDIKNPTIITPETFEPGTETVKIADFVDNNGNIGELRAPTGGGGGGSDVIIDPVVPLGNKVKIADYSIDGVEGILWAPAGGNGEALKEEIYTNQGSSADDITLTDDYDKYDLLFFTLVKSSGGDLYKTINSIDTSKLVAGDLFQLMGGSAGADWLTYEVINKTQFDLDNSSQTVYVESIVGVGLGSGDTVTVTQITSTGTKIATINVSGTDTDLYAPNYTLPIASDQTLGGVKVDGGGLSIDQNGVLAVDADSALDSVSENPVQNKVIKIALDGKVDTNGTDRLMTAAEGTKLAGIATGAEVNVQADWNESDNSSDAYINNKPSIPATLDDLTDVSTTGVTSGQVLTYNGTGWEGTTPSAGTVTDVQIDSTSIVSSGVANITTMTGAGASAAGAKGLVPAPSAGDENKFLAGDGTWKTGGGSGASALDDLTDVTITSAAPGDILKYDDVNDVWINAPEVQEMTQIAYNTLTPAQKADGSVRYVYDAPTTEVAETVLGTSFEYADLSSVDATELLCVVLFNGVIYAGFKFDLSTRESSVLTAAEITEVATILQMQVSTNFTCTITQNSYTPSCTWSNWDWYNTSTMYLDATDMSSVGVRNSYYEFSTSLLYKTAGSNGNNIYLNNRSYSGSGGATVVANPSGTATDELKKIQIDNTIYDIVGDDGSSFITTLDHENRTTLDTSFTLSDSITNYDLIMFQIYYTGSSDDYTGSRIFNANDLISGDHASKVWIDGGNNDRAVEIEIIDSTHYKIISSNGSNGIYGVYGIKLSGGNSPITTETTILFNDTIKGTGNYTLEDSYENYDFITIVGGIQSDEQYGCKEVRTYSVAGLKAFFSANVINNIIFSGYAYRYFRFRIVNDVFTIQENGEGQGLYTIYGHKLMGGGGSGNLTAVELTQAEYDELTPEEKNDTSKIYFITDGTGGGGSSYSVEDIYTGTSRQTTMQLSKTIDNFDAIEIEISWLYSNKIYQYSIITSTDRILNSSADYYCLGYNNYRYVELAFTNNSTITWNNGPDNIEYVSKVKGIKYGSSNTEDTEVPSYIETTIYESSTDENTYNLSQPITDFDAIVIMAQYTGQVNNAIISRTFLSSEMIEYIGTDNRFELASDSNYIWVGITDASTFTKKAQFDFKVIKIVGINYGLGKGIGKNAEIIPITNPTDTASRTFTFSKTPKRIAASYNSSDSWYGFWNFIWGDEWAQFTCKAKSTGVANPQSGLSQITYGSDGKSFTITGANSFQALNSSGGYGQMYVDYGESNNQLQEDYSLTEQRIGTWIDNKPIYRIVLQPWRAGTIQTGYSILNSILTTPLYGNINIDTIVDTKLLNHRTDNSGYTDIFVSSQAFMGQAIVPNKNGTFYIGDISYLGDVDIILDYTKVTI